MIVSKLLTLEVNNKVCCISLISYLTAMLTCINIYFLLALMVSIVSFIHLTLAEENIQRGTQVRRELATNANCIISFLNNQIVLLVVVGFAFAYTRPAVCHVNSISKIADNNARVNVHAQYRNIPIVCQTLKCSVSLENDTPYRKTNQNLTVMKIQQTTEINLI
ncbi:hypothetical protein EGR_02871 [Echinococcus granulosus]|uniref:Uncharacterized protein n=1 Tax=Echinococcus granulosus TaxID=6210 RepID=W6UMX9_ECHGR|nr:hypothetical protein EGR_02871 [Echinococcus granulosus]EUB62418.1 hypothetical protein EGR_02871 [Echinococcus granulosus]